MLSEERSENQFEPAKVDHSDASGMDRASPENSHSPPPPAPPIKTETRRGFTVPPVIVNQMSWIMPPTRLQRMNTNYAKSMAGLMKLGEILMLFVIYCCSISALPSNAETWVSTNAWTAMVVILGMYISYVVFPHLSTDVEATREGLAFLEIIFYAIMALFHFVGIWLMVFLVTLCWRGSCAAAVLTMILLILATVIFAMETMLKVILWKREITTSDANNYNVEPNTYGAA